MRARESPQRDRSARAAWCLWTTFCANLGVSPDLSDTPRDKIPVLQIFAHRYLTGRLLPCGWPVRYCTVEDALQGVGQAFTRVGAVFPRLNAFVIVDARLSALFQAWKRRTPSDTRKTALSASCSWRFPIGAPCPHPLGRRCCQLSRGCILLLAPPRQVCRCPKTVDNNLFRLQDLGLWIGGR
jgi:hypothetical protein